MRQKVEIGMQVAMNRKRIEMERRILNSIIFLSVNNK